MSCELKLIKKIILMSKITNIKLLMPQFCGCSISSRAIQENADSTV